MDSQPWDAATHAMKQPAFALLLLLVSRQAVVLFSTAFRFGPRPSLELGEKDERTKGRKGKTETVC